VESRQQTQETETMKRHIPLTIIFSVAFLCFASLTHSAAEDFYKDKTIRFVVGFAAGGGYDLAARIVGRHIGKHIPGNPTSLSRT
jgi:tripartite-type tricarboxylate transporter receptor subunit TctC